MQNCKDGQLLNYTQIFQLHGRSTLRTPELLKGQLYFKVAESALNILITKQQQKW